MTRKDGDPSGDVLELLDWRSATFVEPLYMTDPFEASIAASAVGQQVIADGLVTVIES